MNEPLNPSERNENGVRDPEKQRVFFLVNLVLTIGKLIYSLFKKKSE